jgi:CRISPR-associated protein Csb1
MVDGTQIEEATKLLNALLGVEARKPGSATKLPAAIRVVEHLEPAGGKDFPVFPTSYAGDGEPVYDLSGVEYGETSETIHNKDRERVIRPIVRAKLCTLDSPQSQANRMEPAFVEDESLQALVPQDTVTIPRAADKNGSEHVLRLPHRIADFRVRLSDKKQDVKKAISDFAAGNALPLLRLMPTSVLFGFWDSRGEQAKHARILLARIDAFDVVPCQRHAVYNGPYSQDEFAGEVLGDPSRKDQKTDTKKMAEQGYTNALSDGLGGVLVQGRIERLALLSLTDIARVRCLSDDGKVDVELTNAARRYLFALAGLAEGYPRSTGSHRLRSGCELVPTEKDGLTVDLRGGDKTYADAEKLTALFKNRGLLVKIADAAKTTLGVPADAKTFIVTKDDLKSDFTGSASVASPAASSAPAASTSGKGRTKKS